MKYHRDDLLEKLRWLTGKLGRPPKAEDITAEPGFPSFPTYKRHFGSLEAAREEAGVGQPARKVQWTIEDVDGALKRVVQELGHAPRREDLQRFDYTPSISTIDKIGGGFGKTLARIGVDKLKKRHRNDDVDDQQLLDHLAAVADDLGRAPTMKEYREAGGPYSDKLVVARFVSWNGALARIGREPNRQATPQKRVLRAKLRSLARRLGRSPQAQDLRNHPDMPSFNAYQKRYGDWFSALEDADLDTSECRGRFDRMSNELLLDALRELARRLGRTPDSKIVNHLDGFPGMGLYKARFGSWSAALEASKLPFVRKTQKATDGHLCDSRGEVFVDNFLSGRGIEHDLHPLYPPHKTLNPDKSFVADWRLTEDGSLVEYFGMTNVDWYDEKRKKKVALAKALKLTLIEILPDDLTTDRLAELFAGHL